MQSTLILYLHSVNESIKYSNSFEKHIKKALKIYLSGLFLKVLIHVLLWVMVVFIIGNSLAAVATSVSLLLTARVISAFSH